jgi:CRP/FNR family transcriptional regulator, cyclic AMP receptor protein
MSSGANGDGGKGSANSLARLLRVQSGEGRVAGLVAGMAFAAMTAYTIGQSGIDALFFDRIGPQALPTMYVLQGATSLLVMLALTGVLGTVGPRRAYLWIPLVLGGVVLVERALLLTEARQIYFVLAVTGALGTLVFGICLWGVAGTAVDRRQAKRLFPIIAGGGIFGSVLGGVLTPPLARLIGAENLLFTWAGGLGAAFVLARLVLGPRTASGRRRVARARVSPLRDMADTVTFIRRSRLLSWMSVGGVLLSVLFYLLYLPYARAASERFADPAQLAGFFGLFWAGSTLAALLVSMLVTNRLIGWRGVPAMVVVLPALYAAAFGTLFLQSGFVTLVALRFVLCTWLQGAASPAWETLTNVTPDGRRDQARAFLNGVPMQIGTVIAGLLVIIGRRALTLPELASIGLVTAALTVLVTVGVRRSYAGALADALRAGRPQIFERLSTAGGLLAMTPHPVPALLLAGRQDAEAAGGTGSEAGPSGASPLPALDVPKTLDRPTVPSGAEVVPTIDLVASGERVRDFVRAAAARATADRDLARSIPPEDEASACLRDAVVDRGRRVARSALWAASTLGGQRDAMTTAIEHLDGGPTQVPTALEALEAAGDPALVRPLLALWDPVDRPTNMRDAWVSIALRHDDPTIRECAELAETRREGAVPAGSTTPISAPQRALFLRSVAVFADLSPLELRTVADLLEERSYGDGDVIADEGEIGEELHVVMAGTVRVVQGSEGSEREIARIGEGEVVGEMSVITRAPRMASLIADGPVRTMALRHLEFESILRERPGVGLAVMRVLAQRLAAADGHTPETSAPQVRATEQPAFTAPRTSARQRHRRARDTRAREEGMT